MFSFWFRWSFQSLPNTSPVSDLFYPSFSQRSQIIHCWAVLSTDKEQSLCNRWPLFWMFEAGNQVFSLIQRKQNTKFCNLDTLVSAVFSPHLTPCVWHLDTVGKKGGNKNRPFAQWGSKPPASLEHFFGFIFQWFDNASALENVQKMFEL